MPRACHNHKLRNTVYTLDGNGNVNVSTENPGYHLLIIPKSCKEKLGIHIAV